MANAGPDHASEAAWRAGKKKNNLLINHLKLSTNHNLVVAKCGASVVQNQFR
jgi:Fe-S cluster biosynthesis and repair protein YggX